MGRAGPIREEEKTARSSGTVARAAQISAPGVRPHRGTAGDRIQFGHDGPAVVHVQRMARDRPTTDRATQHLLGNPPTTVVIAELQPLSGDTGRNHRRVCFHRDQPVLGIPRIYPFPVRSEVTVGIVNENLRAPRQHRGRRQLGHRILAVWSSEVLHSGQLELDSLRPCGVGHRKRFEVKFTLAGHRLGRPTVNRDRNRGTRRSRTQNIKPPRYGPLGILVEGIHRIRGHGTIAGGRFSVADIVVGPAEIVPDDRRAVGQFFSARDNLAERVITIIPVRLIFPDGAGALIGSVVGIPIRKRRRANRNGLRGFKAV